MRKTIHSIVFGLASIFALMSPVDMCAQQSDKPTVLYGQTRQLIIGGIKADGVKEYDENILIGISGLNVGDVVTVPGDEITAAVKRYWKHGLFSNVRIEADEIRGDSIYLRIILATRPKVSEININGVKKNEKEDLETKMGRNAVSWERAAPAPLITPHAFTTVSSSTFGRLEIASSLPGQYDNGSNSI